MPTLGDGAQITTVEDKEIVLTATNGQYFRMKIADLAEAVRQVMPVVTSVGNGLMEKNMFSTIKSSAIYPKDTDSSVDINKLFKECRPGVTIYILTTAAINAPGAGILLHFQRTPMGDLSVSQRIHQFVLMNEGKIRCRTGYPLGAEISYSNWRDI